MDPWEGYKDCTWREGVASSFQCSLGLRETCCELGYFLPVQGRLYLISALFQPWLFPFSNFLDSFLSWLSKLPYRNYLLALNFHSVSWELISSGGSGTKRSLFWLDQLWSNILLFSKAAPMWLCLPSWAEDNPRGLIYYLILYTHIFT